MIDSSRYVVLDVETNGLSSVRDDLLSISIYKPDDKMIYNRFLPLELDSIIYTTSINGIKKSDLKGKKPLTQLEFDELCEKFELKKRIILTYGSIDEKFIKNYLKRKSIIGYDDLKFYNFKHDIISSRFSGGNITKDNLCNLLGIDGVREVHSGENDCILEWLLFCKMDNEKLFITNDKVFKFNRNYIIPASYLDSYNNFKYCVPNLPKFHFLETQIFKEDLDVKDIKKIDNNINGIAIEHMLNIMLNAKNINQKEFLIDNKKKLEYIGKLPSIYHNIDYSLNDDGTIEALYDEDLQIVDDVNRNNLLIKQKLQHVVEFIKNNIFKGKKIYTQELVVNKQDNVLACCDLSSDDCVMEIKTYNVDVGEIKNQLFYQSNGRECYLLRMEWNYWCTKVSITISKIEIDKNFIEKNSLEYRTECFRKKIADETISLVKYVNTDTHVILKCNKCGTEWDSTCIMAQRKNICPKCYPKVTMPKAKRAVLSKEEIKNRNFQKYISRVNAISKGYIECLKYNGSRDKSLFKCKKCGYKWETRSDHVIRNPNCPDCRRNNKK